MGWVSLLSWSGNCANFINLRGELWDKICYYNYNSLNHFFHNCYEATHVMNCLQAFRWLHVDRVFPLFRFGPTFKEFLSLCIGCTCHVLLHPYQCVNLCWFWWCFGRTGHRLWAIDPVRLPLKYFGAESWTLNLRKERTSAPLQPFDIGTVEEEIVSRDEKVRALAGLKMLKGLEGLVIYFGSWGYN